MSQACHIRWMIRRDLPRVMQIDDMCFDFPWKKEEYIRTLRQRNNIGMVAEFDGEVVGYMIYELHKSRLDLLTFGVDPAYARRGVGSGMIDKLKSKLSVDRREKIAARVADSNLDANSFFRSQGFKAVRVFRGVDLNTGGDEFQMEFKIKAGLVNE